MNLLHAEAISLQRSGRLLLDQVNIDLQAGELVGLIGPNGAGKSTLLRILAGLQAPNQGQVHLRGLALQRMPARERSRQLAWLAQSGQIHWPLLVERLVALGRLPHLAGWQQPGAEDAAAVEYALQQTDTLHLRARDATTLSGGERTRVLLARALAAQPDILLADEPVAALDPGHQLQTMELLREFARGQRGCIVVLHELSLAARYCDRLYLLQAGRVADQGAVTQVLSATNLREVYGIECAIGCEGIPWVVPVRRV